MQFDIRFLLLAVGLFALGTGAQFAFPFDDTEIRFWPGVTLGVTMWASQQSSGWREIQRRTNMRLKNLVNGALLAVGVAIFGLLGLATLSIGAISHFAAFLVGFLVPSLVFPTKASGIFIPFADERFQRIQALAYGVTLRVTVIVLLIALMLTANRFIVWDAKSVVAGVLAALSVTHAVALWWFERQDGEEPE